MNHDEQHRHTTLATGNNADGAGDGARLLTAKQAAQIAGLGTRTLYRLQATGDFPPALRIGGSVRWRRDLLEKWIDANCPKWQKFTQIYCKNGEKTRK